MEDRQARIKWIESLSPEEREKYFDASSVYIVKTEQELAVYGDLASLYLATGGTKCDKSIHRDDWCGKAEIDARGNIVTEPTLSEARERKKAEISATAEEKIQEVQGKYMDGEKSTFAVQRKGAEDITSGVQSAEAAWIESLVKCMNRITAKETTVAEYAEKIQAHVKADDTAIAEILGIRKGLCEKIGTLNTVSKIQAVR